MELLLATDVALDRLARCRADRESGVTFLPRKGSHADFIVNP